MIGLCPKCLEIKKLTKHHVYPRRHFSGKGEPVFLCLCRECHTDLECIIRQRENGKVLKKEEYLKIAIEFLKS